MSITKLERYFPWATDKKDDLFPWWTQDTLFSEAIRRQDFFNLQRVFTEKPKFRASIAYHLVKKLSDETLLEFIKQTPDSISFILMQAASSKRLALAQFIFTEFNGWVLNKDINFFISFIIGETSFLKMILAKELVKPSIIILHHELDSEQFQTLLDSLTTAQLFSVLADSRSYDHKTIQILKYLENKGALQKIYTVALDTNGNTFLHLASPLLINKISQLIPLPKTPVLNLQGLNPLEYQIFTGNFAMAASLRKFNFPFNIKAKHRFIAEAILHGLECNEDKHSYNALAHLLKQANIEVTEELHYLHTFINNPKSCQIKDKNILKPYLYRLVDSYIQRLTDQSSSPLMQIQQVMQAINRDFSLEIIAHAGYFPKPLTQDEVVFIGGIGPIDEDFIKSFLELGYHSSFAFKDGTKFNRNAFLNYDTKSSCVYDNIVHYEFCGNFTYVSQNPFHSLSVYASSRLKNYCENTAFLIEARLEKGEPKVAGSNIHEYEFITHYIDPDNIRAVYIVDASENIVKSFINPNYRLGAQEKESFFISKGNNLTVNLEQARVENRTYYDSYAQYRRPSKWNNQVLKFNKSMLPKFLDLTHKNMTDNGFEHTKKSIKIELERQSYLGLKNNISSYSHEYGFFAKWKKDYENKYPEKCKNGYGPGAIIPITKPSY